MSRIAKASIFIPIDIEIKFKDQNISIKGKNGELIHAIHKTVEVKYVDNCLNFFPRKGYADGWALAGTTRALLNGMIIGVTNGFTKKLILVGVGYRAAVKDNVVNLSLGFSHVINHKLPIGVNAECPIQTEIIIKGINKQLVGQVAADLRAYRPPEPYKGKGVRYAEEIIYIKEAKKK